jgi:5-methylcytosine-specific restriction endonuclease McrA
VAERQITRDRACAQCGASPITGTKYCSRSCQNRRRPLSQGVLRDCVVCGQEFRRWKKGDDDALKCCSRECGFELLRIRGAISRFIQAEKRIYRKWAKAAAERARLALIEPDPPRMCQDCGKVELDKYKRLCPTCQARRHSESRARQIHKLRSTPEGRLKRKAWRRVDKARRRAVERGVYAERFDPLEVLDRDGWRCHICGISTPKRLRGTFDDRAPELDHIIPISKGGQHTRQNTACACRRCNIVKSGEARGQMRLFG